MDARTTQQALVAIAAAITATGAAGVVAGGSRARRTLGVSIGILVWLVPWLAPAEVPPLRAALVIIAVPVTMRIIDVARSDWPTMRRLAHATSPVDLQRTSDVPRGLDARRLSTWLAWSALSGACLALILWSEHATTGAAYWATRWGAGLVGSYASAEGTFCGLLPAAYRLAGKRTPPLHRAPAAARTVGEFWGSRWNILVSSWFRSNVFRTFARLGWPRTGMALVFAVSAAMHAYIALVATGAAMAGVMFAYFIVQGVFALLEGPLGTSRWPAWTARAWTISIMIATSPLFVEPFLCSLGVSAKSGSP